MHYKLNLMPYNYTIQTAEAPGKPPKETIQKREMKKDLADIILNPRLGHNGFRFYTVAKTSKKIRDCKEDFVLLDTTEYVIVKDAFDKLSGFGPGDEEMVKRVYEVEKVE